MLPDPGAADIWEVAEQFGGLHPLRGKRGEAVVNCPFCGDKKRHMYLNREKNVFHCMRCGASGGMKELYARLGGVTTEEAGRIVYGGRGPKYRHPAERLTEAELKALGFRKRPDWANLWRANPRYARDTANWVWAEWKRMDELIRRVLWLTFDPYRKGGTMNKIFLVGRLTAAPELKYTNGKAKATFSVATERRTVNGEKEVEFVPCVAWEKLAENVARYVVKGQRVSVVGRLKINRYRQNGEWRYYPEVVAAEVEFYEKPRNAEASAQPVASDEEVPW